MVLKKINQYRLILTSLLLGSFIFILVQGELDSYPAEATSFEQSTRRWTGSFMVHDPIKITSNTNFTTSNGITQGSGTPASPWIIENWIIFAKGEGSCIIIANTTDSFVIRMCSLWEASPDMFQAGIVLQNVTNARLENNNCYSNDWCGIYLRQTNGSVLQDNWCWDNRLKHSGLEPPNFNLQRGSGIFLEESHGNLLSNNNCTNNLIGISLVACKNNTVLQNTLQNNFQYGISLQDSVTNVITANIVKFTSIAINIEESNRNGVEKNEIRNTGVGILIESSMGNLITHNSISWSQDSIKDLCVPDPTECNIIEENQISVISPMVFGYWYGSFRFWPGIVGWVLSVLTVGIWILPPLKRKSVLLKQKKERRALNMKEEYYTELKKEHGAVLAQLNHDSQGKKNASPEV